MRILLAGSTGVIGRRLGPLLSAQGHDVVGLARNAPNPVDVLDADAVTAAVLDARPDVIVHQLTSLSAGDRAANARLRRDGTRHLVDAALAAGVRRMVVQSISWAYRPGAEPAPEQTPLDLGAAEPRLTTVAGVDALESSARELPEWVVLRYGTLYGPETWYSHGGLATRLAAEGTLAADADVSSFLHIDDAVGAAAAALDWPVGAVNICDDDPAAATEWVPAFCAATGVPAPAHADGERHGWARGASNRHAREQLGWTPAHPTWRTGFASM